MAPKPRRNRPREAKSAPQQRALISTDPTLIVVELGSEWPSWMSEVVGGGPRRVLCQLEGEDCIGFAMRVANSVAESASLPAALLLCNQRADGRQMLARRQLLTRLIERQTARLCLGAASEARAELREELGRLAAELPDGNLRFGTQKEARAHEPPNLASVA